MLRSIYDRVSFYGKNTNIHGVKYIADENRHFISRLFWLIVLTLNIYGMFIYFYESYKAFNTNAVSFVTETTYLHWNTTFPAISICEIKGADVNYEDYEDAQNQLDEFIHDLAYFTGDCYSCSNECEECDKLNFTKEVNKAGPELYISISRGDSSFKNKCTYLHFMYTFSKLLPTRKGNSYCRINSISVVDTFQHRKSCDALIGKCKWNNKKFECCNEFLPMETEYGICYTLNSIHTKKPIHSNIDLISNRKTGAGHVYFQSSKDVRMNIHAPEDVPFINSDPDLGTDILLGEILNVSFNVIEIENDENVVNIPIHKRGCRFPWELPNNMKVHQFYSYSSCVVQCRVEGHLKLCGCTHHHMPVYNKEGYCSMQGLKCLTDQSATVNALHAEGYEKLGLVCNCVPSCNEPEYKIVSSSQGPHPAISEVNIRLQSLPTHRFKRIVTRTTMDLVVSFGGTAGLFIGASLLSIVETVYLLFIRKL